MLRLVMEIPFFDQPRFHGTKVNKEWCLEWSIVKRFPSTKSQRFFGLRGSIDILYTVYVYIDSFFGGVCGGIVSLFFAHIKKKCPHISLFQVPDGSPSGEKQIGGEPPRGFGVFCFFRPFLGGSDSMPHADVEFRCLSYKTPVSSTRQSKHKRRPCFEFYNIHHSFRDFTEFHFKIQNISGLL